MISWESVSDIRMDRLPTGIDDGTLLYNFAGVPNEIMTGAHAGLQNGVTCCKKYNRNSDDGLFAVVKITGI